MKAIEKKIAQIFLDKATPKEIYYILSILLTEKEYAEILNRFQILQMLDKGDSQRTIASNLGVGIATVTRGSKELKRYQKHMKQQ